MFGYPMRTWVGRANVDMAVQLAVMALEAPDLPPQTGSTTPRSTGFQVTHVPISTDVHISTLGVFLFLYGQNI